MNSNGNLISALRNMVDDIENLGAAPLTVDVSLLKQAIAALTPPEGYVLVPVEPTHEMLESITSQEVYCESCKGISFNSDSGYAAMLAARPEVSP